MRLTSGIIEGICANVMSNFYQGTVHLIFSFATARIFSVPTAFANVDLFIQGNRIPQVGKTLPALLMQKFGWPDCVVYAGFTNAHSHLLLKIWWKVFERHPLVPGATRFYFRILVQCARLSPKMGAPSYLGRISAINESRWYDSCINMDTFSFHYPRMEWYRISGHILAYTLRNKWVPEELRSSESVWKTRWWVHCEHHHLMGWRLYPAHPHLFVYRWFSPMGWKSSCR